jgi:hypothetical protein
LFPATSRGLAALAPGNALSAPSARTLLPDTDAWTNFIRVPVDSPPPSPYTGRRMKRITAAALHHPHVHFAT